MSFTGLDHVGFSVSDLDRSIDWYTRFLNGPPVLRRLYEVEYIARVVGYPGLRLDAAFWHLPAERSSSCCSTSSRRRGTSTSRPTTSGTPTFACSPTTSQAEFDRLRGFVEFRSLEPVEILWGPYQGGSACYLRDPDGISVELLQPPPGGPAL